MIKHSHGACEICEYVHKVNIYRRNEKEVEMTPYGPILKSLMDMKGMPLHFYRNSGNTKS